MVFSSLLLTLLFNCMAMDLLLLEGRRGKNNGINIKSQREKTKPIAVILARAIWIVGPLNQVCPRAAVIYTAFATMKVISPILIT